MMCMYHTDVQGNTLGTSPGPLLTAKKVCQNVRE